MKNRAAVTLVGVLFLCLALFALLSQAALKGCLWWECVPSRPFRVADLDLPSSLFPSDAAANSLAPLSDEEETIEDGIKSVYWDEGIAVYTVLRYPTIRQAAKIFSIEKNFFVDDVSKELWTRPPELNLESAKANEFYMGCGNWQDYRCGMTARYEEYVVHFNAVIGPSMTYKDFEGIVVFIDRQISNRLYP